MMEVEVMAATPDPLDTCSMAAGCCYGKENVSERRLATCMNAGHLSVFEHASATWSVKGISRACSHQLVRHRLASYSQQSQRYCKIDVDNDDWYVTPPRLVNTTGFKDAMRNAARAYQDALEHRINPEDARFILPNACKTNVFITMNFREFMHFMDVRLDKVAQWEVRELAEEMSAALAAYGQQWHTLVWMYREWSNRLLWGDKDD